MKIGIISDTHGDVMATRQAADVFRAARCEALFHCGDIGGEEVLAELAALSVPVYVVFGNCDDPAEWRFFPTDIGVHLLGRFGEVTLAGHAMALLHGDHALRWQRAISSGNYALVLSGHTHRVADETIGTCRWLNPGSAARSTPRTCMVLDLASSRVEAIELNAI